MVKGIDFIAVAVVYFCHDGKGRFVMGRRTQNARDERGRWDIGGGGVEMGDTLEQTLRREIKEEYGTDVLSFEFLGYRDVFRIQNGQKSHWLALDFKVLINPSQVQNGEPHKFETVGWFAKNTMPDMRECHSQLPVFLKNYQRRLWN